MWSAISWSPNLGTKRNAFWWGPQFLNRFQCFLTLFIFFFFFEQKCVRKIKEQFCIKVHNIITSSNFLIYEGKSLDGSAYHKKEWMVLFIVLRRRRLYRAKTIFSWYQNTAIALCDNLVGETEYSYTREWEKESEREFFLIEIEKCRPRPSVCQFPFHSTTLVQEKSISFTVWFLVFHVITLMVIHVYFYDIVFSFYS